MKFIKWVARKMGYTLERTCQLAVLYEARNTSVIKMMMLDYGECGATKIREIEGHVIAPGSAIKVYFTDD